MRRSVAIVMDRVVGSLNVRVALVVVVVVVVVVRLVFLSIAGPGQWFSMNHPNFQPGYTLFCEFRAEKHNNRIFVRWSSLFSRRSYIRARG